MAILEVENLKKIYTTRFGAQKVQALADVSFSVEEAPSAALGDGRIRRLRPASDRPGPTAPCPGDACGHRTGGCCYCFSRVCR